MYGGVHGEATADLGSGANGVLRIALAHGGSMTTPPEGGRDHQHLTEAIKDGRPRSAVPGHLSGQDTMR